MTDNLILYELQKVHETLTKTKEEHTLNFRIKSSERFNFSEPILKAIRLGLFKLSVHNSVFNVFWRRSQFLYDSSRSNINETLTSYSKLILVSYELNEIAESKKEETNGNVIVDPDNNKMKSIMEIKQGAISFDVENSIAPSKGFRKMVYKAGKFTSKDIWYYGF